MAETQRPILTNVTRLHHYMDHAGCAAVVVRSGKKVLLLWPRLSAARWEEMQRLIPGARLVDCTALLAQVRWVKTPGEIQVLKAADILDDAYLEVFPTVRPGETERDVHSRLVESCMRRGAQWVHGILNSSRNTVAYGGEGDPVFQAGDIICTVW